MKDCSETMWTVTVVSPAHHPPVFAVMNFLLY